MRAILALAAAAAVALAAGCASFDGSSLVPGKSTAAEAEALMGAPAERLETAGGGRVLYYPHVRETYAVVVGPDGLVRAVERRRTSANLAKLVPGATTAKLVREIFGPPGLAARNDRQQHDVWEYQYMNGEEYRVIWVQFSFDGVVREVLDALDWSMYSQSGSGWQ
ncbi:MAG: hypothetical protein EXR31_06470 [Betaproteobacteria bacterium]|nr:hypothetical protein [Betaproteobacteria bacterium]